MFVNRRSALFLVASALALYGAPGLRAQSPAPTSARGQQEVLSCDFSHVPGVVWWGTNPRMTMGRLVSYLAPVYWFSPDEPLLDGRKGADIRIPEALPFETIPDAPVVYYQMEEMVALTGSGEAAYTPDGTNPHNSIVDLEVTGVMRLSFFAYFSSEEGLGAHPHDVEAAEFKIGVPRSDGEFLRQYGDYQCDERTYVIIVTRVTGKAHGIVWFWNLLDVDAEAKFPMYLLVEEGKHGIATDKNSDGHYTPGYDVNRYINDAWGTRDVIRSGALVSGSYQAWMTKTRTPEYRAFPPLPEDSPLRAEFDERAGPEEDRAVYELRPFPPAAMSEDDPGLHHFMKDKEVEDWPEIEYASSGEEFLQWVDAGRAVKSLAISLYTDGDLGFSWAFPFFIVKNLEVSVSGGFLVHRMYLKDEGLRDFGWMLLYTPSASRWFDTYLAAGAEWDEQDDPGGGTTQRTDFVMETGLKFRVNITTSAAKFLSFLTPFWGFRAGIKNYGFTDIDRLTYVFEFGAGVW